MRDFSYPGKSLAFAERGMIATSHPYASMVGLEILKKGGNAIDAGIAAIFTLCVIEPSMVGIGGDCFALYGRPGHTPLALNGSGWAPQAATIDHFAEQNVKEIGPNSVHAITIPGIVGALYRLHQDLGHLEWAQLLQPAIDAAQNGYIVTPRVALDWSRFEDNLKKDADAASQFLVSGRAPRMGDKVRNPHLAVTLAAIAKAGAAALYTGAIAEKIVAKLKSLGGLHTTEDFGGLSPDYVAPISTEYAGQTVFECPPNGQGIIALMIMNILKKYRFAELAADERITTPFTVKQHGWGGSTFCLFCHHGTHVDAPNHFIDGGDAIHEVPLQSLVGPAAVCELVDHSDGKGKGITGNTLEERGKHVERGDIVILKTLWSDKCWGTDDFWKSGPYLTPDGADWIVERGAKAVVYDFSEEARTRELGWRGEDCVIHHQILGADIYNIEYVKNLGKIERPRCTILALPLPLVGLDGSPTRVVAMEGVDMPKEFAVK